MISCQVTSYDSRVKITAVKTKYSFYVYKKLSKTVMASYWFNFSLKNKDCLWIRPNFTET